MLYNRLIAVMCYRDSLRLSEMMMFWDYEDLGEKELKTVVVMETWFKNLGELELC